MTERIVGMDEYDESRWGTVAVEVERGSRYGSVPGLDDEELADPEELERQVMLDEWGPILSLPVKRHDNWIRPTVDEDGTLNWAAFGTVDFLRLYPFDKRRYAIRKAREELREDLRNAAITLSIVQERLSGEARAQAIDQAESEGFDFDDMACEDMRAVARCYLRAKRLRQELRAIEGRRSGWSDRAST